MFKGPVPVIMYHSVGIPNKKWNFNYLTCPFNVFESQLKWIKNRGFNTISLYELYEYMSKGISLPNNPVVLTFDDGYGDNWVFAYPLLKKYGMKATIYVNPEFTEFRKEKLNLQDVWENKANLEELDTLGYLSWEELKVMEEEGLVDIQSHSMTHTWYPQSDNIIDFRHQYDPYLWMTWNDNIDKKPDLQIDDQNLIKFGQPVYEHGRSIGIKKFFPDEDLNHYLEDYVKNKGNISFFNSKNWKTELFDAMVHYKNENRLKGRFETEEEYEERIFFELNESKKIIEKQLKKEVNFLCWPGGAVNGDALKIASEVGYLSSTVGRDILNRDRLRNLFGEDPSRINRIFPVLYWDGQENSKSYVKYMNGFYSLISLYYYKGGLFSPINKFILYLGHLGNKLF